MSLTLQTNFSLLCLGYMRPPIFPSTYFFLSYNPKGITRSTRHKQLNVESALDDLSHTDSQLHIQWTFTTPNLQLRTTRISDSAYNSKWQRFPDDTGIKCRAKWSNKTSNHVVLRAASGEAGCTESNITIATTTTAYSEEPIRPKEESFPIEWSSLVPVPNCSPIWPTLHYRLRFLDSASVTFE